MNHLNIFLILSPDFSHLGFKIINGMDEVNIASCGHLHMMRFDEVLPWFIEYQQCREE